MNKTTEKIPTWSLGYIINGDATGLTHHPLFGLPTEVEDCEILYTDDNI